MVKVYRIGVKDYIKDISGTGAKLYGGRWNSKGNPILYCAQNVSLAILEILVHFDGLTIPKDLFLIELTISNDDAIELSKRRFNSLRNHKSAEYKFKEEGDNWIQSCESLMLKVPSIITHYESNILINPQHPKFQRDVKINKVEEMELDERLFK